MQADLRVKPPKLTEKPLVLPEQVVPGVSTYVDMPISVTKRKVPVLVGREPLFHEVIERVEYAHEPLRWLAPGPDGKLIPKEHA